MKIILVDSKPPFRETVKNLLLTQADFDLVGVGEDGYDAIRLTDERKPDVIILDLEVPLLDGMRTASSLRVRRPEAAIIAVADEMDDKTIINAVCRDIKGFLLRNSLFEDITSAVRNVTAGNSYMSRPLSLRTFNIFSRMVKNTNSVEEVFFTNCETKINTACINRTELQITAFIGQGLSNKQISEILKLKEGTIRNYISIILQKTHLKHRTQIALYALKNGFYSKEIVCKTEAVCKTERRNKFEIPAVDASQLRYNFTPPKQNGAGCHKLFQ
jgi:DNA-binding NarL/FixJ family response regulator